MVDARFTEPLLEAAYRRGWLARSARAKVTFLLEQGLHLEQAFIGLGILTATQYASIVQEVFQVSLERIDQDRWHVRAVKEILPNGIMLAESETGERVWFVADAWEEAQKPWLLAESEPKIFVFYADLLRWRRRQVPVDFAVSAWWDVWRMQSFTEARVCVDQGIGHVWVGADAEPVAELRLTREEVPALQAWFETGYPHRSWQTTRLAGTESDVMQIIPTETEHPAAQLTHWQSFLREPRGILVCFAPDAWVERALVMLPETGEPHQALTDGVLRRVRPQTHMEREQAWHAALAGASFCWIEDLPDETTWIRPLAQAGIPVTVLRRRETLHGSAWEAYHLSYEAPRPTPRRR